MDRTLEPDEALLVAAVHERAAFGVFYERHERSILGFFGALTRRPEVAADLTAETFALALEAAGSFDATLGSARMWLFGIARNVLSQSAQAQACEPRPRAWDGRAGGPVGAVAGAAHPGP